MYKGGAIPKTRRQNERQKRTLIVYFLVGAFVAGGLISGFWSIPRIPYFLITSVEVEGNETITNESLQSITTEILSGDKYIFFPRKNIFWFSEDNIRNAILKSNPRILSADVSRTGFNSILINVKERTPSAIVCKEDVEPVKCFNADIESILYTSAPNYKTSSMPRFYSVGTSTILRLGDQFLIPNEFKSFLSLTEKIKKAGYAVDRINIKSDLSEVVLQNTGKLLLNKEQNMDIAFDNFKTLIESKDFKEKVGEQLRFEYIDLRFGNKLFYKI